MKHSSAWRIFSLIIIFLAAGAVILFRFFSLQLFQYGYYSVLAQDRHQLSQQLFAQRGEIFMQDLSIGRRSQQDISKSYFPAAINKEFQQVFLVPKDIPEEKKEEISSQLSDLLGIDKETILQRISKKDDPYEPLKSKLDDETAQKIRGMAIPGVELTSETWRYYPNNSLACHLLGFVGMKDNEKIGQYGVEGYYEDELKGKNGFMAGEKDTGGYWIPSLKQRLEPAENGSKLILTIDQNIQFRVEKELNYLTEKWQAESGAIIVMEPDGAIRAMANWPVFNPNEYNQVEDIDVFLNPSVQETYEPGSAFKPITMAAGLDSGKIRPETIYYDSGQIAMKGGIIKNAGEKSYGEQTMTQVLEKSLNTGAVFVQQRIGEEIFKDYIQRFNFHRLSGIDLFGEITGNIANLFTGREVNLATISFGQGISVTPLSLLAAIGAIANQGKMAQPFIVEKIIRADGSEITIQPKVIIEPISEKAASDLTKMLVSVAENGFDKRAGVAGYNVAVKTGTAQIPDLEKGGYSEEETIHTFVGFAPAFNPKFAMLIKLDKPKGIRFASDSLSPSFSRLSEYLLNYFEIPPQ